MNKDSIKKKLNELNVDPKSKGFLSHLIKAYLPLDKTVKVIDKPKEGRLVCVLTNQKLITVNEILSVVQSDDFKESLNNNLKVAIEGKLEPTAMTKALNGKVLAFTGEKTTTFMSFAGIQALGEWITDKLFEGDAHIKWLVGGTSKLKTTKSTQAENNGYRKPSTTFGDLSILKDLKAQMVLEESETVK